MRSPCCLHVSPHLIVARQLLSKHVTAVNEYTRNNRRTVVCGVFCAIRVVSDNSVCSDRNVSDSSQNFLFYLNQRLGDWILPSSSG
jgi:hypothetical protein